MNIVWYWSPETESLRLIQTARDIANGFFHFNNFIVSENLSSNANSVVFPKLNYLSISRFWSKVKKIDIAPFPYRIPYRLVSDVSKLTTFQKPDTTTIQTSLIKHQKALYSTISCLIPEFTHIREIIIIPTNFGTTCSFSSDSTSCKIHIYLRSDSSLIHIIEAVLSILTRKQIETDLQANWSESEIIIDWLISKYFQKYDPNWKNALTIPSLRATQNGTRKLESAHYISSLGAPFVTHNTLHEINSSIFPAQQQTIFKLLLNKSHQIVTYDEISEQLYPNNPNKFSLYAISKQIQRLRNLLEKQGVSGSLIQTKRGEGYFLAS